LETKRPWRALRGKLHIKVYTKHTGTQCSQGIRCKLSTRYKTQRPPRSQRL